VTRSELARGAGVDAGYLWRIEAGTERPSLEIYARPANALGADLAARLYPNTGPTIRDRHQAGILEALLSVLHPRWKPYLEIAVRRPSRGWIDVGLHVPRAGIFVAVEIQSELRRLEQFIRWSAEKAASLPSWEGWTRLGDAPTVSQLLIVRDTRTTRMVAREFRRTLDAAFPANPEDALGALTAVDRGPAPGSCGRRPVDPQAPAADLSLAAEERRARIGTAAGCSPTADPLHLQLDFLPPALPCLENVREARETHERKKDPKVPCLEGRLHG
jgi:transcriptional regulator with XRE-family HTH domain